MTPHTFQSVDRASFFTRMDFRPKLALMTSLTIVAFTWESPTLGGLLALAVILGGLAAGVRPSYVLKAFLAMLPFYLFVVVTQGFFGGEIVRARTGQTTLTPLFTLPKGWWLVGGATMSVEGIKYALNIVFKALTMTMVIPLVVFTTDVNAMIVGLVKAHIPYAIAFVFSSTLRFFPLLVADLQSIIEAQRLRGLAFERMGPIRRARVYAKVAVPLILGAIVKSQTLEVVLQSKAFSGSPDRTYYHESRLAFADYAVLALAALFLLTAATLYFGFGIGKFGGPV